MGLFKNQFLNVIEWNETREDVIFWMWKNNEIKIYKNEENAQWGIT